jgi:hypothetical protein
LRGIEIMALIKCKECGKELSSAATACPHCGKPAPKQTTPAAKGCLTIIIVIVVLAWIGHCSSSNDVKPENTPVPASPPSTDAPPPAAISPNTPAPTIANDEPILNDAAALDAKYGTEAFLRCGSDADDYLRGVSKFAFKWDEMGFLDAKFDKLRKRVSSPGVLTMISNKVSLQNGFGAYERIELLCNYDTQNKKILGYSIEQP